MGISRKVRSEVVARLERVAVGLPPVPRKNTKNEAWRRLEDRGDPTICAGCEGCGRMNFYVIRRVHRRWEWRPFHPRKGATDQNATPSIKPLKDRIGKSPLEQLLDMHSKESYESE